MMKLIRHIILPAYEILNPAYRRRSILIIGLMVLQAVLDFLNVSAFIPILALVAKPEALVNISWVKPYASIFSYQELILFLVRSEERRVGKECRL